MLSRKDSLHSKLMTESVYTIVSIMPGARNAKSCPVGSLHLSGVTDTESISVERGKFSHVDTSKAPWEPRDLIRGDAVTGRILNIGPEAASGKASQAEGTAQAKGQRHKRCVGLSFFHCISLPPLSKIR